MHRLIEFIKRIYVLVIFLLVEGVALWTYASSSPYTEAKILSRTTAVGGAISNTIGSVEHFFSLPETNRMLTARVAELSEQLEAVGGGEYGRVDTLAQGMSERTGGHFRYHEARVVSLTTNRLRNSIILDKGSADGIAKDMGVVTPKNELVGYVVLCSDHYCVVQPMLSVEFSTGGRLVDNGHVCMIIWSGQSQYRVEAKDLSVYSEPHEGMVVEVRSERLPEGVVIGTIEEYELNSAKSAYSAVVNIAADMSRLDNVLIVENTHYGELQELQTQLEVNR
jgi:rod shape-determining protein MreC